MNTYLVTFDFADYEFEVVKVYAKRKSEINRIMKNQYGRNVKIHDIEKIEEE